jgi:hypothetical protein
VLDREQYIHYDNMPYDRLTTYSPLHLQHGHFQSISDLCVRDARSSIERIVAPNFVEIYAHVRSVERRPNRLWARNGIDNGRTPIKALRLEKSEYLKHENGPLSHLTISLESKPQKTLRFIEITPSSPDLDPVSTELVLGLNWTRHV